MPIQVSEAIDTDTAEIMVVTRTAGSGYVNGLYVKGATSNFNAMISWQQPTPQMTKFLKSGEHYEDLRQFYSLKRLYTGKESDSSPSDVISYEGKKYKVVHVADWNRFGHTSGLAARDRSLEV